jgi:toxin CcdB
VPRFDLYGPRGGPGLLLDIQSNVTSSLATRVVVPLLPASDVPAPLRGLHPVFRIEDRELIMATQLLAAVPRRELGRAIGNLEAERDTITRALDILFTGF